MYMKVKKTDTEKQTLGPSPCSVTPKAGGVFLMDNFAACSVCSPPTCATPSAGQSLAPQPPPDDAEQQAALLLACSGDTLPASLPPVNMYDLFEALQVSCYADVSQAVLPWVPAASLGFSLHAWRGIWFLLLQSFPLIFGILWFWLVPTIG